MSESLTQAINDMRNMREVYNGLQQTNEVFSPELQAGKSALASAITNKGVETASSDTLTTMAGKVNAIAQESYTIDGGEMYAKQLFGSLETPNYWNLYEVLAQLLSDGRLVSYGGILLAEYYKGYDSLALSGAGAGGAYVVSDKDSQGNFIMYTNDTTHVWDTAFDGKGNRWVAYCFADEYHDFQITDTNTSPRSIFIGRKVGTITCLAATRISEIVVPDEQELTDVNTNSNQCNWGRDVIIRNLKTVNNLVVVENGVTENLYVEADKIESATGLLYSKSRDKGTITNLIIVANEVSKILINDYSKIGLVRNVTIRANKINTNSNNPTIRDYNTYQYDCDYRISIISEDADISFRDVRVAFISLSYINNDKSKSVNIINNYLATFSLTDIIVQNGWCKPLDISVCINLTEANMYTHILQRLKQDEANCGSGVTITLGTTNLNKLTSQESQDLLASLRGTYGYTFA